MEKMEPELEPKKKIILAPQHCKLFDLCSVSDRTLAKGEVSPSSCSPRVEDQPGGRTQSRPDGTGAAQPRPPHRCTG